VVHDLELDSELGVLVLQGVEAVRARGDDLLGAGLLKRLGVLHRQALEDELISRATGRVTGAGLPVPEHREGDVGQVKQLGNGARSFFRPVLVGACAAHPEQPVDLVQGLHVLTDHGHRELQPLGPVHSGVGGHVPGVALVLQALEELVQLGREFRLTSTW
jgi:hypothetical protein